MPRLLAWLWNGGEPPQSASDEIIGIAETSRVLHRPNLLLVVGTRLRTGQPVDDGLQPVSKTGQDYVGETPLTGQQVFAGQRQVGRDPAMHGKVETGQMPRVDASFNMKTSER